VLSYAGVVVTASDGAELLHGVDLAVPRGSLTVLAGASGSGKSTLLRLANRLEVPSAGQVRFDGVDLATIDPLALRRRVGMVFQRPTPFAGTVRDNLLVAAAGASDGALGDALARVGLEPDLLDRSADDLSGGEAQRMCLARTLLTGPEVVLMDEVTSSLDPAARRGVEELARRLVDDGLTVVWVTHDLRQAERLGDRIVVLSDGRVADDAGRRRFLADLDGSLAPEVPPDPHDPFDTERGP
jgi:putative ABC transport system ATP-binding protein